MTIADIANMLPPNEAKRWNGWEPDYLKTLSNTTQNTINDPKTLSNTMNSDDGAVNKDNASDVEEELVLVNSFINSRNTISALPGPYRNVLDMPPKNFKVG